MVDMIDTINRAAVPFVSPYIYQLQLLSYSFFPTCVHETEILGFIA